ncbi:MAG: amidohydrolase family protein [Gemmatimonadales bacterium]
MPTASRSSARRATLGALALLVGASAVGCGPERVPADLLIEGVTLIDGTGADPVPDRAVAIEGDRIVAVGPSGSIVVGDETARIDGTGQWLMPGLWDMHVHLGGYGEGAFPLFLANGVTTIRELGDDLATVVRLRDEVRSGRLLGPEMLIAGPILDAPFLVRAVAGTRYEAGRRAVADSASAVFWVDSLSRAGVDQLKVHSMTPRAAYFAILGRARQLGLPVVGHLPDSVMPREAIEAGQRTIEHTWRLDLATSSRRDELARWELEALQHAIDIAGDPPAYMPLARIRLAAGDSALASFDPVRAAEFAGWAAEREVWFDPTLVVIQAFLGLPEVADSAELRYLPAEARSVETLGTASPSPAAIAAMRRRYLSIRASIDALIEGGARFVAGTDVPVMPLVPGFALHHELGALVDAGLTPMQALEAATANAARAAGRIDRVGTVAAGMRADLVLLDADPLAAIGNTRRIRAVVRGGRLLDRAALDGLLREAEARASGGER